MLRLFCISMLCLSVANAQPLTCKEDVHCSERYYCDTQTNVCQECLRCQDLKRQPPKPHLSNECIKTINRCGPCAEGFINIYRNGVKGKCVVPELFVFGSGSHYNAYVCMTAAGIGLLIVVTFIYVIIKQTDVIVFRVVAYLVSTIHEHAITAIACDLLLPIEEFHCLSPVFIRYSPNLKRTICVV